ncbi:MAG: hypothetical protein ACLTBD_09225 [Clostridia bacterium]
MTKEMSNTGAVKEATTVTAAGDCCEATEMTSNLSVTNWRDCRKIE